MLLTIKNERQGKEHVKRSLEDFREVKRSEGLVSTLFLVNVAGNLLSEE